MADYLKVIKELFICFAAEALLICSVLFSGNNTNVALIYKNSIGNTMNIIECMVQTKYAYNRYEYNDVPELDVSEPDVMEPNAPEPDRLEPDVMELNTPGYDMSEKKISGSDILQVNAVEFIVQDIDKKTVYAQDSLNVRSKPYASSERIGILSMNEPVIVTGIADTGWYRLEYNGSEAYVSNRYVSDSPVEIKTVINTPVSTGIVEILGNVPDKWVTKAAAMIAKLPQNVLDRFVSSGYHFYVTDEDLGITEFNGTLSQVAGATKYGEYIKIEDRQFAIDEAVLHEFGHFVFHECGNWNRQDVTDAFNNDVRNASIMGITYGIDSVSEFYAEIFQAYIKNQERTAQTFPNLVTIIQADIDSL